MHSEMLCAVVGQVQHPPLLPEAPALLLRVVAVAFITLVSACCGVGNL